MSLMISSSPSVALIGLLDKQSVSSRSTPAVCTVLKRYSCRIRGHQGSLSNVNCSALFVSRAFRFAWSDITQKWGSTSK
jgi:hypothetical protein